MAGWGRAGWVGQAPIRLGWHGKATQAWPGIGRTSEAGQGGVGAAFAVPGIIRPGMDEQTKEAV